jgi:exosortase/archaeosortase family protein
MRRKPSRSRSAASARSAAPRHEAGDTIAVARASIVREQLRFVGLFALVAGTLFALYVYPFESSAPLAALGGYMHLYALLAGAVLHVLDHTVSVAGTTINGRATLAIVRGCDAAEVVILYSAAVVATHIAGWGRRLVGVLGGLAVITVANVGRICSLYFIEIHKPLWEEAVHHEVWPLILMMLAVAVYASWAGWARRPWRAIRPQQTAA